MFLASPAEEHVREAVSLLSLPFVRNYLLNSDALADATVLTDPVQRAASFSFDLHRVVWGSARLETEAKSLWLCTPAFSHGSIIVGCVVQKLAFRAAPQLMATRPDGFSMLRFVADAASGQLLTISAPSAHGTVEIQYASYRTMSTRFALSAVLRDAELRAAVEKDFDPTLLRRAILLSFAHRESRPCPHCRATCTCRPTFAAPRHTFDFSVFTRTMGAAIGMYAGSGSQQLVIHSGAQRVCSTHMHVQLAVRQLDDTASINTLWSWGVHTRFRELPIYPMRLEMPKSSDERWRHRRSIVEELEDEQRATRLALDISAISAPRKTFDPISPDAIAPNLTPETHLSLPGLQDHTTSSSVVLANPVVLRPTPPHLLPTKVADVVDTSHLILPKSKLKIVPKSPCSSQSVVDPALTFELVTPPARQPVTPLCPSTLISGASSAVALDERVPIASAAPKTTPSAPQRKKPIAPSCESLSDVSSSTGASKANDQAPRLPLPVLPVLAKAGLMKRNAPRIEINPNAPPAQQSTYIGERDKRLLDRKERNRKSAARSNLRRKQARMVLERDLRDATRMKEELETRRNALESENALLKRKLATGD